MAGRYFSCLSLNMQLSGRILCPGRTFSKHICSVESPAGQTPIHTLCTPLFFPIHETKAKQLYIHITDRKKKKKAIFFIFFF